MNNITVKIILIGDSGVGKSSLLSAFMGEPFNQVYTSTVGVDFEVKHLQINGRNVLAQIWDTAGQERFRTITNSYYRSSHAIMFVYDVTDLSTFRSLDVWLRDVLEMASPDVEMVLCANKADASSLNRAVSYEVGRSWAEANDMLYVETSALQTLGVDRAFERLIEAAANRVMAQGPQETVSETDRVDLNKQTRNNKQNGGWCC